MKTRIMIFLLFLFVCDLVNTESIKPRSVNLALDTILEFNNKDNRDIQIIDNVQGFLNKIKHVLKDKTGRRSMTEDMTFTDFLIKFFEIIKGYEDEDLEDVVAVLDDEIRKYHYVGCKFYELLQDTGMRRFVGRKLDETKDKDAKILRSDFQTYIQMLKDRMDAELNEFFAYINSLYSKEAKPKMRKFLNNLELYKSKSKRANLGLIKMVRQGVREIVFDHYTNLNVNARRDFKIRLETFWKNFVDPNKVEHKIWNVKYNKSKNTSSMGIRSGISSPMYSIFKNYITSIEKSTDSKVKIFKDLFENSEYTKTPFFHLKREGVEKTKVTKDDGIFMKDLFSLLRNPMKPEPKRIDDNLFGSFSDDVTNKNIVKEFEKSIDLRIPDIPKIVKDRFDSSKDKILKTKQELLKDIHFNFKKDDFTAIKEKVKDKILKSNPELSKDLNIDFEKHDYTTKKEKVKKHKTKLRDKKHKTLKRFSVVATEGTTKPLIYDSLDMSDVVETITEIYTTRKQKPKAKRKRKDTKATRSRFMTLYTEHHKDYTTKVKKTKKERMKHKAHKSKKDKSRVGDKRDKNIKMRDMTIGDYEEITDKTTKAKKYREKHEKSKHKKRKHERKQIIRSDATTKKSRKVLNLRTPESSEGMSIESFEQRSYRKNINFDNFKQNVTTREYNDSTVKNNNNVTKLTTKQMSDLNVTKPIASTFGRLDFWPGTPKSPSIATETTILPNSTLEETKNSKEINDSFVPRTIDFNKTLETVNNDTMRFIDVNNIEYNTSEVKLANTTGAKTTEGLDKESTNTKKVLSKRTTTKPVRRRGISISRAKPKITTAQATEPPETTKTTEVMFKENTTAPFIDVMKFLNKSDSFEDGRRQNIYRDKILQDMKNIFFPATTSTSTQTTQSFTDPFAEIENALGIE